MLNKETYENNDVIHHYSKQRELQVSERNIFALLKDKFKDWNVLDIGIGGGRTTANILPHVKSYTGIDISMGMVESCRKTFDTKEARFLAADARDLQQFDNESYDFVLFSFNGIDCVPYEDREKIIKGIIRILKPGGYFCFSTHNTRNLDKLYSFHFARNPFYFLYQIKRYFDIRRINGPKERYKDKQWFSIKDGAEYFKTDVVYLQPELQLKQLEEFGFQDIQMFDSDAGEILDEKNASSFDGGWVYFLCHK